MKNIFTTIYLRKLQLSFSIFNEQVSVCVRVYRHACNDIYVNVFQRFYG